MYERISPEALYARTGIQKQIFNTIYQLMAVKQKEPQLLAKAKYMLLIPNYFNFLLTGVKRTEYMVPDGNGDHGGGLLGREQETKSHK